MKKPLFIDMNENSDRERLAAIRHSIESHPSKIVGVMVDTERSKEWKRMLGDIEGLVILREFPVDEGRLVWCFQVKGKELLN